MREIKNLAATMNGEIMGSPHWTSISEDGSTGGLNWQLAVYTNAPDSPLQFLMCFLKYVLSIVVMQYILARRLGGRAGKKGC